MRIRKKKWIDEELENCKFVIKNPNENIGVWKKIFNNENSIYLELGCGKGGFASQFAIRNLDKNLIAVDMVDTMLGLAKRKIEKAYLDENQEINNICLTSYNVERISEIFNKCDKIERIYINFCNPWPKPKHKKRRLTHSRQLEQYKKFLVPNGEIWFKTDDDELFEESLEYFKESGFEILEEIRDLHSLESTKLQENFVTEHENMFSEQGIKIKFAKIRPIEDGGFAFEK